MAPGPASVAADQRGQPVRWRRDWRVFWYVGGRAGAVTVSHGRGDAGGRSWVLWALAVAGLGILIGVLILGVASARLEPWALRVFLIAWIVVPYVVSGAVAWWRRPASRLGPLMLLTGFVMGLTPMQWSSQPLVHSVGNFFDMLPAALFLPRLPRLPERPGPGPGRAGPRRGRVCGDARPPAGEDPARCPTPTASSRSWRRRPPAPSSSRSSSPWWPAASSSERVLMHRRRSGRERLRRRPADARRRRVQLRPGDARAALRRRAAQLAVPGADPAGRLRRAGAGAVGVPLRLARPPARARRRGWSAGGAAVGPDIGPSGAAGAGRPRPVSTALLLAARVRELGRPGRHAHAGADSGGGPGSTGATPGRRAHGCADFRPRPGRGARAPRRCRRPRPASPWRTAGFGPSSEPGSTTSRSPASGCSRPAGRSDNGSSATCTTAPRSVSSRCRWSWGCSVRPRTLTTSCGSGCCTPRPRCRRRWRSCATWREGSTLRCSPTTASRWLWSHSPPGRRYRCSWRRDRRTPTSGRRGGRLLRRQRGARQRRQARGGHARSRYASNARTGGLVIDVRDNGQGGAQPHPGSGLDRLGLRVEALGGRLAVRPADGGGVEVHAELPCL